MAAPNAGCPHPRADLPGLIGHEIGVSRWITVDQARTTPSPRSPRIDSSSIDPVAAAQTLPAASPTAS
jgi:hypothetical protein